MRRGPQALLVGCALGCLIAVPARGAGPKAFTALLNGGQETPPNTSAAFGVAFVTFDESSKMLCYSITSTRLDGGNEVAAHFHGPAVPGQMADVLFAIDAGNPKHNCFSLTNGKDKKALKKGLLYLNIHTQQFPGGEIRGQVLPAK